MFQEEKVERDDLGYWLHSALNELEEEQRITELEISKGMEFHYDEMLYEVDEESEIFAEYERGQGVAKWEPTRPDGDGWFLIGIYETEDGPFAAFARPKQ